MPEFLGVGGKWTSDIHFWNLIVNFEISKSMSIIDNTFYLSTPNDIVYLCVKLVCIHTKKIGKISHKKLGNLLFLGVFSKTCPVM